MQLLINNKYKEVGFWSFAKCAFLSNLAVMGIIYGTIFLLAIIIGGFL
jgi:hypothetical protein